MTSNRAEYKNQLNFSISNEYNKDAGDLRGQNRERTHTRDDWLGK